MFIDSSFLSNNPAKSLETTENNRPDPRLTHKETKSQALLQRIYTTNENEVRKTKCKGAGKEE